MADRSNRYGDFTSNLGKIYGIYTGGFFGFVDPPRHPRAGRRARPRSSATCSSSSPSAIYAIIGIVSRTMQVSEYYVAGRRVPAFYNGMATGADWMSAASFIGMAGTLYALGYDGLAYVLGWTGGYVLVAVLVAPYLRKFGAYTVPDFLSARYGGNLARLLGIIVLLSCSFTYVVAQIVGTGLIASRFIGMDFQVAVYRRPGRHPGLLDARRHAGRHLDAGRAVHRADRRLPHAGGDPLGAEVRPADPAAHLRPGAAGDRCARAGDGAAGPGHRRRR